jgi:violaxanthin de-epoxidase
LSLSYFRYILAAKTNGEPDDYVFVYYRGKNDAWDGYGGAVVYTRSKILPPSIIPELQQAAKRVKLDFNKFTPTDNTCGPEPPLFARLEKKVEEGERFVVQEVEDIEQQVEDAGKAEISLFEQLTKVFRRDEERFFEQLGDEEKALLASLKMEAADLGKLFGNAIPLRNLR